MAKVTDIEARILQLGSGEFQKFCDTFLSKKAKYGAILGLGMRSSTQKTTIGNPDTYFRKDNGKYVFVTYTTQQSSIYEKIKEDIDKCLDFSKTGVDIQNIEEIICCHTSSNLKAGDDQNLHDYCTALGIKLTIFGVDEIAQQIYNQYKSLAKDFLGLAIDTNQIMSVDEFVRQYDANEMAAPLDTIFQFRENELSDIESAILKDKVVIIYGKAGTGKTRIALEVVKRVAGKQGYHLLCVKNNNLGLYDDLVMRTEIPGKYLFFVDDANELIQLKQILQYTVKQYLGYEVKIVMTVRDYAKEKVIREAGEFTELNPIELKPFTDDEIRSFLDTNMEIRNQDYVDQIIRIAEGNPRIAYMAGKLAKEKQSLSSIHDATQLYEHYYSAYVDSTMGTDSKLCLTAGILAILGAVFVDNLNYLDRLLEIGGMSEGEFKDNIYRLSKMEFVEIPLNQVAMLSDQCLANYMLYYTFFKSKRIPFSEVLKVGFHHFRNGVLKSLNTLFHIFANEAVREYMALEINKVWDDFKDEQDPCYEEFVRVFHTFRPEEAFVLANDKISVMKEVPYDVKQLDFKKNYFKSDGDVLELLTGYQYSEHMETVMELFIAYVGKTEDSALEGYHWLENHYDIDQDSYKYDYYTEYIIAKMLNQHCEEKKILAGLSLARISYALAFEFHPAILDHGDMIRRYTVLIQNTHGSKRYRKEYWECLKKIAGIEKFSDVVADVLQEYANSLRGDVNEEVVESDHWFVLKIMDILSCGTIRKLLIWRELLRNWEKKNISIDEECREMFAASEEWQLYQLLENDFLGSELSYEEYEKVREDKLVKFSDALSIDDIKILVKRVNGIITDNADGIDEYVFNNALDIIIDRLCEDDQKTMVFFEAYLAFGNKIKIYPGKVFEKLCQIKDAKEIYKDMQEKDFPEKNYWQFVFFERLPDKFVDQYMYSVLLDFLRDDLDKKIESSPYRRLRFLDKFMKINPNVYIEAARIIFEKRKYSDFIVGIYFGLLFHEQNYTPKELLELFSEDICLLKNIYFYMLDKGGMSDLNGVFLSVFLESDESWLETYTEFFWQSEKYRDSHVYRQYKVLWKSQCYQRYIDYIFYHNPIKDICYSWRICDTFRKILYHEAGDNETEERQFEWVMHIIRDNALNDNINIIFDVISELEENLRREAIKEFLLCNSNFDIFKKLQLESDSWGGSGSMIPVMQERIDFLESLFPYVKGVIFLKHRQKIQQDIEIWKSRIKREELEEICRDLYR